MSVQNEMKSQRSALITLASDMLRGSALAPDATIVKKTSHGSLPASRAIWPSDRPAFAEYSLALNLAQDDVVPIGADVLEPVFPAAGRFHLAAHHGASRGVCEFLVQRFEFPAPHVADEGMLPDPIRYSRTDRCRRSLAGRQTALR